MSRSATMTIGFLVLFVGIKSLMVESYYLTPQATRFWIERIEDPGVLEAELYANNNNYSALGSTPTYQPYGTSRYNPTNSFNNLGTSGYANNGYNNGYSPFQTASYRTYSNPQSGGFGLTQKRITPARWVGWAMSFLGTVLVLHGATVKRS